MLGVEGSTMALNLQSERLRAVGCYQLIAMEGTAFAEGVTARTQSGNTRAAQ